MNIRIGNDICLYVNLLGNKNLDAVNVNSIEAFLINTSKWQDLMDEQFRETALMQDEINCRKDKIKYVSRFPVEPHFPGFHPTPYDVCCTGRPGYHCRPVPYVPAYHGYGVYPHTFERGCFGPHIWHPYHRNPHPCFEPHTWACDDMHDIYERAGFKHMDMQRQYDRCRFLAPVEATENKNKVKVYFPAQAQLYTGTYKLVIVAKVYEPGYCKNNLRTITIDYENVFTIVNSSDQGCDGNVTIRVGTTKLDPQDIRQVRVYEDNYTLVVNNELKLGETDYNKKVYKILIDLVDGSTVEYNPGDWDFGSLVFESMSPRVVSVNQTTGKLTAVSYTTDSSYDYHNGNSSCQCKCCGVCNTSELENPNSAVIKVYNNQHDLMTSFNVNVVDKGFDYIVFIKSDKIEDVHNYLFGTDEQKEAYEADGARAYAYENIFGTRFISNPTNGAYMWIVSRDKIADSNTTLSPIKTSMFDVPLKNWRTPENPQIFSYNEDDRMYYHLCPNPLINTLNFSGFDITVEP